MQVTLLIINFININAMHKCIKLQHKIPYFLDSFYQWQNLILNKYKTDEFYKNYINLFPRLKWLLTTFLLTNLI